MPWGINDVVYSSSQLCPHRAEGRIALCPHSSFVLWKWQGLPLFPKRPTETVQFQDRLCIGVRKQRQFAIFLLHILLLLSSSPKQSFDEPPPWIIVVTFFIHAGARTQCQEQAKSTLYL